MGLLKSKVTLACQTDAAEIVHYLLMAYPAATRYTFGDLAPRVKWFIDMGYCVIAREEIKGYCNIVISGHIQALLLGRPVEDAQAAFDQPFYFDARGHIFYVDIFCSRHPSLIYYLAQLMIMSVGLKESLAFSKEKGNISKVHILPLQRLLNLYAPMSRATAVL
jgi:hypothetical protein